MVNVVDGCPVFGGVGYVGVVELGLGKCVSVVGALVGGTTDTTVAVIVACVRGNAPGIESQML